MLATGGKHLSTPQFGVAPDNKVQLRLDNYSSNAWQWSGKVAGADHAVTVAPGASETIELSAKGMVREFGFVTFEVESAKRGVIPTIDPDKAPSPISTFDMVIEPAVAPLLAPPPATVFSRVRNRPWEHGLIVDSRVDFMQGDKHDIQVAFTNHTAGEVTLTPKFSAKGASVLAAPKQIVVPAGATKTAAVTLQAAAPGAGELVMSAEVPSGQVQAELPFNVIANALLDDPAAKVKTVEIAADVFYTGGGSPQVTLNGVKVGPFFSEWTPHPFSWYSAGTRFRLNEAAASAVGNANKISFDVPASLNLKVRNLALVVIYEDGTTAILPANPTVQSTPVDSGAAEGQRVARGEPMVWQCPAGN